MVPLEGGRYATSDVNGPLSPSNQPKQPPQKLKEINAPDVILRTRKNSPGRQWTRSSIIPSAWRGVSSALIQSQRRALKSISDNLKGKRGLFRQNLLGKRVDYSGTSVMSRSGQNEALQFGLPKLMALELFRPFVVSNFLKRELAYNIRGAGASLTTAFRKCGRSSKK